MEWDERNSLCEEGSSLKPEQTAEMMGFWLLEGTGLFSAWRSQAGQSLMLCEHSPRGRACRAPASTVTPLCSFAGTQEPDANQQPWERGYFHGQAAAGWLFSPQHARQVHYIDADFSGWQMPAQKGDLCTRQLFTSTPQHPNMLFSAAGTDLLTQQCVGKLRMVRPPTAPGTWRYLWKSSQPGALQRGRAPFLSPGRHMLWKEMVVLYRAVTLAQTDSTVSVVGTRGSESTHGNGESWQSELGSH